MSHRRRPAIIGVWLAAIIFFFGIFYTLGCHATTESPLAVTPSVMVRMFRDNPGRAADLYAGKLVAVPMRHGKYNILAHPPIIVSDPPPTFGSSLTIGYCTLRKDGVYTGDGCDFTIVIESAVHR